MKFIKGKKIRNIFLIVAGVIVVVVLALAIINNNIDSSDNAVEESTEASIDYEDWIA